MTETAKEYGAALFMLAAEEKSLPACADGLRVIRQAFADQPDYPELLSSPSVPLSERLAAITAAFGDTVPEAVLSFLQLLCEKGRIACFFDAADEFQSLLDAHNRVAKAQITSAVALTKAEKEKLCAKLERISGGRVEPTYAIDPTILGGLVIELDGKVLDGSLRHRLRDMKDVMNS